MKSWLKSVLFTNAMRKKKTNDLEEFWSKSVNFN